MQLGVLSDWSQVPVFSSLEEESEFWRTHEIDTRLMEASLLNADHRESTSITLRFDPRMLARIKRVARSRYLNYQSMMKQWLAERLHEEALKEMEEQEFRNE